ncbi:hypothetical protein CRUP_004001, partial [Coryphaenoides rupestris]
AFEAQAKEKISTLRNTVWTHVNQLSQQCVTSDERTIILLKKDIAALTMSRLEYTSHSAHVVYCASKLRHFGDSLHWRYKLLEMLLMHYKNIIKY